MRILKLLIVEGNTKEENLNFNKAGCVPQSENFQQHIKKIEPTCEIDIVEPDDEKSISKIIPSLGKYHGVVLTGSTLRLKEDIEEYYIAGILHDADYEKFPNKHPNIIVDKLYKMNDYT